MLGVRALKGCVCVRGVQGRWVCKMLKAVGHGLSMKRIMVSCCAALLLAPSGQPPSGCAMCAQRPPPAASWRLPCHATPTCTLPLNPLPLHYPHPLPPHPTLTILPSLQGLTWSSRPSLPPPPSLPHSRSRSCNRSSGSNPTFPTLHPAPKRWAVALAAARLQTRFGLGQARLALGHLHRAQARKARTRTVHRPLRLAGSSRHRSLDARPLASHPLVLHKHSRSRSSCSSCHRLRRRSRRCKEMTTRASAHQQTLTPSRRTSRRCRGRQPHHTSRRNHSSSSSSSSSSP